MKRLTLLALGLTVAGAFAVAAQAAPESQESNYRYQQDRTEYRDNYREDRSDNRDDNQYGNRYENRTSDRLSDSAIDRRVTRALYRALGEDANDIHVRVRNGNVILSGVVDRPWLRRQAREIASNVWGVHEVYARNLQVAYR
jgi:type II secretory ATPase GspE/PulE/Tfp pilus assembly ATPase PilB-like protein